MTKEKKEKAAEASSIDSPDTVGDCSADRRAGSVCHAVRASADRAALIGEERPLTRCTGYYRTGRNRVAKNIASWIGGYNGKCEFVTALDPGCQN